MTPFLDEVDEGMIGQKYPWFGLSKVSFLYLYFHNYMKIYD